VEKTRKKTFERPAYQQKEQQHSHRDEAVSKQATLLTQKSVRKTRLVPPPKSRPVEGCLFAMGQALARNISLLPGSNTPSVHEVVARCLENEHMAKKHAQGEA
jgi:hypothetical protein